MIFKIRYLTAEPYVFLSVGMLLLNAIMIPQLLLDNICQRNFNATICSRISSPLYKEQQEVIQRQSAFWLTGIFSSETGLCILAILFIGPLADTIGIRNTMFLTPAFMGIDYVILITLTSLRQSFHPALLLLPAPFASACGSISGSMLLANSYIAKITTAEDRTFRMAFVSAAFSFSTCLFSFLSGFLLDSVGYRGVFITCLAICILNALYLGLFLSDERPSAIPSSNLEITSGDKPEKTCQIKTSTPKRDILENDKDLTNPQIEKEATELTVTESSDNNICKIYEDEMNFSQIELKHNPSVTTNFKLASAKSNPLTKFKELYSHLREHKQRITVLSLLFGAFTAILSWNGELYVIVLFIKSHPLNYSAVDVGYFRSFQGLNWGMTGYLVMNLIIQQCCHCSDFLVITISLLAHAVYLIILGLSTTKAMIYVIQLISALAALDISTIRSSLTKTVALNKYVTILAVSAMLQAVGAFVASFMATVIYGEFVSIYRGTAFSLLALFPLISVIISGRLLWRERLKNKRDQDQREIRGEAPPLKRRSSTPISKNNTDNLQDF